MNNLYNPKATTEYVKSFYAQAGVLGVVGWWDYSTYDYTIVDLNELVGSCGMCIPYKINGSTLSELETGVERALDIKANLTEVYDDYRAMVKFRIVENF